MMRQKEGLVFESLHNWTVGPSGSSHNCMKPSKSGTRKTLEAQGAIMDSSESIQYLHMEETPSEGGRMTLLS